MTPQEFVIRLRGAVVEENTAIYRDLFSSTSIEKASDPYWRRALGLFGALSPEQREVFLEVVRQVAVDTTSNVLGVIDGVNALGGGEEFELDLDGKKLSGDLQSLFLAEEERCLVRLSGE
ncbi:MAG: hypothetical protein Q8O34_07995 [Rhodocyclaceae bacterium]|nr:hypothetical protein [Rhodocyclaceae bacterium]